MPIRCGEVETQSGMEAERESVGHGPEPGTIWINARLLPLLDVTIGDNVGVGSVDLEVSRILVRAPDAGFDLAALAPRVMMHLDDLEAAGVVQPGSRVDYRNLFAGDAEQIQSFRDWFEPQLQDGQRWRSIDDGQPGVVEALDRAERFLLLGGSLARSFWPPWPWQLPVASTLWASVTRLLCSRLLGWGQVDRAALSDAAGALGRNRCPSGGAGRDSDIRTARERGESFPG